MDDFNAKPKAGQSRGTKKHQNEAYVRLKDAATGAGTIIL